MFGAWLDYDVNDIPYISQVNIDKLANEMSDGFDILTLGEPRYTHVRSNDELSNRFVNPSDNEITFGNLRHVDMAIKFLVSADVMYDDGHNWDIVARYNSRIVYQSAHFSYFYEDVYQVTQVFGIDIEKAESAYFCLMTNADVKYLGKFLKRNSILSIKLIESTDGLVPVNLDFCNIPHLSRIFIPCIRGQLVCFVLPPQHIINDKGMSAYVVAKRQASNVHKFVTYKCVGIASSNAFVFDEHGMNSASILSYNVINSDRRCGLVRASYAGGMPLYIHVRNINEMEIQFRDIDICGFEIHSNMVDCLYVDKRSGGLKVHIDKTCIEWLKCSFDGNRFYVRSFDNLDVW